MTMFAGNRHAARRSGLLDIPAQAQPTPEPVPLPPTAGEAPASAPERSLLDEHVAVGPFKVMDATADRVRDQLVRAVLERRTFLAYALHVGGLNARDDEAFVAAMAAADVVYADGVSVVVLARLAGARSIERAPTTDLGWDVLRDLNGRLGRPVRVALVGGVEGRSRAAGDVLCAELGIEVVVAECGYQDDWLTCLSRVRAAAPDVLLVGLGAPAEMKWVERHRRELPACLVLTCGGWFGFVVDAERRAPDWMQRCGLEWSVRLAQAPRRLGGRYARGAVASVAVAGTTVLRRVNAPRTRRTTVR